MRPQEVQPNDCLEELQYHLNIQKYMVIIVFL